MKRIIASFLICLCLAFAACGSEDASSKTYAYNVYELERNDIHLHLDCMTSDSVEPVDNILLVHGLTYSSHEFDVDYEDYSLVRFLCDNGYAVWRIDIAGYGQSESVEDGFMVDSAYAAKDVCAAIDKILAVSGVDKIDLLGWSWGTVTSALAEEESSELIDKYVMYAPIIAGIGYMETEEAFHENTWENAASDFQMNAEGEINEDITESGVVNTYCSNCWKYDGASSPNGGRKDLCTEESTELISLKKIENQTLVICGSNDPYLNMPLVNNSLEKLPEGSELAIIEGGAHAVMMEKPYYHEFQEKLIKFLKEN